MKKLIAMAVGGLTICLTANINVFADTIITVPVDSRPVSVEYLEDLATLGGDEFICVDKANLDFFSVIDEDNHFGNSKAVRQDLYNLVSENNTSTTRVIINSSSYFSNGLVGSRCGSSYEDYKQALADLKQLMTDFKYPTYYVNLSMPRTLPETRFNEIWRDNQSVHGIGYYYLKYNPQAEDKATIRNYYYNVNPTQLIMEYSYTYNKAQELGLEKLTPWERDFLTYCSNNFANRDPYRTYLEYYKVPYKTTAEIFSGLVEFEKQGLLDEIIVSNDDFQLPNSIVYFNGKGEKWASSVKYSFARTYMSTGRDSIYKQIDSAYGTTEKSYGLFGKSNKINFIFGTDEVPQLIYARDLSKRADLSANIKVISNDINREASTYDITRPQALADASVAFTSYGKNKTAKSFDIFMYDYNVKTNTQSFLNSMSKSRLAKNNIGLIELFANSTMNSGENTIFKTIKNKQTDYFALTELDSYSAWNTNANAIGLGIAHSQVFGIAQEKSENVRATATAQFNVLLQHILEDGTYTIQTKRNFANMGYKPTREEREYSQTLYDSFNFSQLQEEFKDITVEIKGRSFKILNTSLVKCNFPWGRTFDCYVKVDTQVKEVNN